MRLYCAFCDVVEEIDHRPSTEEHRRLALSHMQNCPNHPIRKFMELTEHLGVAAPFTPTPWWNEMERLRNEAVRGLKS